MCEDWFEAAAILFVYVCVYMFMYKYLSICVSFYIYRYSNLWMLVDVALYISLISWLLVCVQRHTLVYRYTHICRFLYTTPHMQPLYCTHFLTACIHSCTHPYSHHVNTGHNCSCVAIAILLDTIVTQEVLSAHVFVTHMRMSIYHTLVGVFMYTAYTYY